MDNIGKKSVIEDCVALLVTTLEVDLCRHGKS